MATFTPDFFDENIMRQIIDMAIKCFCDTSTVFLNIIICNGVRYV